jgi:hypothetical protein
VKGLGTPRNAALLFGAKAAVKTPLLKIEGDDKNGELNLTLPPHAVVRLETARDR